MKLQVQLHWLSKGHMCPCSVGRNCTGAIMKPIDMQNTEHDIGPHGGSSRRLDTRGHRPANAHCGRTDGGCGPTKPQSSAENDVCHRTVLVGDLTGLKRDVCQQKQMEFWGQKHRLKTLQPPHPAPQPWTMVVLPDFGLFPILRFFAASRCHRPRPQNAACRHDFVLNSIAFGSAPRREVDSQPISP